MFTPLLSWPKRKSTGSRQGQLIARPRFEELEDRTVLNHDPIGPPFQVNNLVDATFSSVANDTDAQGNFVVVWTDIIFSEGNIVSIYAQFFDRDGNALLQNEFLVDTVLTPNSSIEVDVAMDPNGNVAITYDTGGDDSEIFVSFVEFLDTNVTTVEIEDEGGNSVFAPSIASFVSGGQTNYILVYAENDVADGDLIKALFLDSDGDEISDEITLDNDFPLVLFGAPDVASDASGNFIFATWLTNTVDFSPATVVGQQIFTNEDLGDLFEVADDIDSFARSSIGIAGNGSNGVIAFNDDDSIRVFLFDPDQPDQGQILGSPVNQSSSDSLSPPDVASAQNGTFAVTWILETFSEDESSIGTVFGRIYNPDGSPESPQFQVSTSTDAFLSDAVVAIEPSGNNVVFAWDEFQESLSYGGTSGSPQEGSIFENEGEPLDPVKARIYRLEQDDVPDTPPPVPVPPPVVPFNPFDPATLIQLVRSQPGTQAASSQPFIFLEGGFEPFSIPVLIDGFTLRSGQDPVDLTGGNSLEIHGRISGRAFLDLNNNGRPDPGEGGLARQIVFIDKNNNGKLDLDELFTRTDDSGNYYFDPLDLREYSVRLDLGAIDGYFSSPSRGRHSVDLNRITPNATDRHFGVIERVINPRRSPENQTSTPTNKDSSRINPTSGERPNGAQEANEEKPANTPADKPPR